VIDGKMDKLHEETNETHDKKALTCRFGNFDKFYNTRRKDK
jgi:hypothetical protein